MVARNIERTEVISSWNSELHTNTDEEKTPTAISFGPKNKVSWGYNIPYDAKQVKLFKLLLVDDNDLPDDVKNLSRIRRLKKYNNPLSMLVSG
ncbi:hypothetical protein N0V88_002821 [Collariella sp. IMI 366227]|nr:hypothetical protein N0V88_002821 [Collariella sp. IMI 366227]